MPKTNTSNHSSRPFDGGQRARTADAVQTAMPLLVLQMAGPTPKGAEGAGGYAGYANLVRTNLREPGTNEPGTNEPGTHRHGLRATDVADLATSVVYRATICGTARSTPLRHERIASSRSQRRERNIPPTQVLARMPLSPTPSSIAAGRRSGPPRTRANP